MNRNSGRWVFSIKGAKPLGRNETDRMSEMPKFTDQFNEIYGTELGFDSFGGKVFRVDLIGSGYTDLTGFINPDDLGGLAGVYLSGGNLNSTGNVGTSGSGDVFKLILGAPPIRHLNLQLAGNAVILTWADPSLPLYSARRPWASLQKSLVTPAPAPIPSVTRSNFRA